MYIEPQVLPAHIRALCGRGPVRVELREPGQSVHIGHQQWDEGTRDLYHVAALDNPTVKPVADPRPWPANMAPLGETPLAARHVIVKTGTFCGKPATPVLYALAADVSPMLPASGPALDATEQQVLKAIAGLNSRGRKDWRDRRRMTEAQWTAVCARLAGHGLITLNKRGAAAITITGRNAAATIKDVY